jgi:hypothetical protein
MSPLMKEESGFKMQHPVSKGPQEGVEAQPTLHSVQSTLLGLLQSGPMGFQGEQIIKL